MLGRIAYCSCGYEIISELGNLSSADKQQNSGLGWIWPAMKGRQQAVPEARVSEAEGGKFPSAKQFVPLGSRAARRERLARKLFIMFVLPFRRFHCSGCCHQLSVLVNSSFKQLRNCMSLVKGTTATEPQEDTYAPISVRILLWLLIIRLH